MSKMNLTPKDVQAMVWATLGIKPKQTEEEVIAEMGGSKAIAELTEKFAASDAPPGSSRRSKKAKRGDDKQVSKVSFAWQRGCMCGSSRLTSRTKTYVSSPLQYPSSTVERSRLQPTLHELLLPPLADNKIDNRKTKRSKGLAKDTQEEKEPKKPRVKKEKKEKKEAEAEEVNEKAAQEDK